MATWLDKEMDFGQADAPSRYAVVYEVRTTLFHRHRRTKYCEMAEAFVSLCLKEVIVPPMWTRASIGRVDSA